MRFDITDAEGRIPVAARHPKSLMREGHIAVPNGTPKRGVF